MLTNMLSPYNKEFQSFVLPYTTWENVHHPLQEYVSHYENSHTQKQCGHVTTCTKSCMSEQNLSLQKINQ